MFHDKNQEIKSFIYNSSPMDLSLPEIDDSPGSEEEEEDLHDPDDVYTLLSHKVRQQYVNYLEKLLYKNYETWMVGGNVLDQQQEFSLEDLHQCAKILEQKVVKSSMIVNLYRKAMLKIISDIREDTSNESLSSRLVDSHSKMRRKSQNASTQTEPQNFLIDRYLEVLEESSAVAEAGIPLTPVVSPKRRRKKVKRAKRHYQENQDEEIPPPVTVKSSSVPQKDEIEANLEKLFASEDKEEDIFETTGDYGAQIQLVLSEAATKSLPEHPEREKSPKIHVSKSEKDPKDILRDSMWPCELRMRRRKLYDIMCAVGDESLRHYERVKTVFRDLFGPDSDEEEAPLSPCIDMDPVTADSCKKRIASTIVKHLMKPYKENLISSRYLFKKLAKRIADNIVMENDYPDERYIKDFIDDYFCIHPTIRDISDIV